MIPIRMIEHAVEFPMLQHFTGSEHTDAEYRGVEKKSN